MNKVINKNRKNKKLTIIITLLIALIVIGGYFYYHDRKNTSITSTSSVGKSAKTSKPSVSSTQGGVTSGSTSSNVVGSLPPSSDWVSSTNGDIVLQQPSDNSTIQSGAIISGTANVPTVQFILTDSSVGLIAQGTLNVVNGRFSGTMEFTPHASTGKLEVYYPNPNNGAEEDIIDIGVNYGS